VSKLVGKGQETEMALGGMVLRAISASDRGPEQCFAQGSRAGWRRRFPAIIQGWNFSRTTSLVMEGGAFYNPSNTALEAKVSFTRHFGDQPLKRTVVFSVSECLNIDLHFGNSQEH
jgi:hypothetical protein